MLRFLSLMEFYIIPGISPSAEIQFISRASNDDVWRKCQSLLILARFFTCRPSRAGDGDDGNAPGVNLWSAWHPDGLKRNNGFSTCHFQMNRTIDPSPWFSFDAKVILRPLYGCIVAYNYAKINLNSNNYDIEMGKRDFQSSIITCSQFVNIFAKKSIIHLNNGDCWFPIHLQHLNWLRNGGVSQYKYTRAPDSYIITIWISNSVNINNNYRLFSQIN